MNSDKSLTAQFRQYRAALLSATVLLGLCVAQAAGASAGKALFVSGPVTVDHGTVRDLHAGDAIDVGDTIVTGAAARAQILMGDGARIALRAGTRFRIDDFKLPGNVQQPGQATSVAATGRSVSTLLQGGFRTRSGFIGKADPSAYEVHTPIGTLGIRGTDYTAVFCRNDCADAPGLTPGQPIPPGLYLGVDAGRIVFEGRGIKLELSAPDFAFIPLQDATPQQLREPPAFLREDGAGRLDLAGQLQRPSARTAELPGFNGRRSPAMEPPRGAETNPAGEMKGAAIEQPVSGVSPNGSVVDFTAGVAPVLTQRFLGVVLPTVGASAGRPSSALQADGLLTFDAQGNLLQFPGIYGLGGAANQDRGGDATTGISWGRWSGGSAVFNPGSSSQSIDLSKASLHWISGPSFLDPPVLPVSGSATYIFSGGTSPTDAAGNIGVFGSTLFSADFTRGTVAHTLTLDVGGLNFYASGSGTLTGGNLFGGTYGTVLIDGVVPGSGAFSGFFVSGGAGLGYTLGDPANSALNVSGVLALVPGNGQAPPAPPPPTRSLAFSLGSLSGRPASLGDSALNSATQLVFDSNGDLTRFVAAYQPRPNAGGGTTATYDIGNDTVLDSGSDAALGLHWGRWSAGTTTITLQDGTDASESLKNQSLHWIFSNPYVKPVVLPTTGTALFVLAGGTNPTDNAGNVGITGNASLSADFTNLSVDSALIVVIDGRTWYGSGAGSFTRGSVQFQGALDIGNVAGVGPLSGEYFGFFTAPAYGGPTARGAGLNYYLADPTGKVGRVNGAIALQESATGSPVTAPLRQSRDIAYSFAQVNVNAPAEPAVVLRNAPATYAIDANYDLTRFNATYTAGAAPTAAGIDIGTSKAAESNYGTFETLRWGRWSGGSIQVTPVSGAPFSVSLANQSLHWIMSGDAGNPPVLPTTGTAVYTLSGGTTPTDNAGRLGAIGTANFSADFTNSAVNFAIDMTFNQAYTLSASGAGAIGANGLAAHQFAGTIDPAKSFFNFGQSVAPASGNFQGFFAGPVNAAAPVPPGVGLSYTIVEPQTQTIVNGVAAFHR